MFNPNIKSSLVYDERKKMFLKYYERCYVYGNPILTASIEDKKSLLSVVQDFAISAGLATRTTYFGNITTGCLNDKEINKIYEMVRYDI